MHLIDPTRRERMGRVDRRRRTACLLVSLKLGVEGSEVRRQTSSERIRVGMMQGRSRRGIQRLERSADRPKFGAESLGCVLDIREDFCQGWIDVAQIESGSTAAREVHGKVIEAVRGRRDESSVVLWIVSSIGRR